MLTKDSRIHRDPDILSATPVFKGTRVPFQTLFDYLKADDSLDTFLFEFPTVTKAQAVQALEEAKEALLARSHSAR